MKKINWSEPMSKKDWTIMYGIIWAITAAYCVCFLYGGKIKNAVRNLIDGVFGKISKK